MKNSLDDLLNKVWLSKISCQWNGWAGGGRGSRQVGRLLVCLKVAAKISDEQIDVVALHRYLRTKFGDGQLTLRKFGHGESCPTYFLRLATGDDRRRLQTISCLPLFSYGNREMVLRKKPVRKSRFARLSTCNFSARRAAHFCRLRTRSSASFAYNAH